jgi:outer membrane lipoprotein-sorting protein
MIIPGKIIVKLLCGIAFVLLVFKAEAQVTLLQNAISKLESYQSFSYRYTEKTQDFNTSDTTLKLHGDRKEG